MIEIFNITLTRIQFSLRYDSGDPYLTSWVKLFSHSNVHSKYAYA